MPSQASRIYHLRREGMEAMQAYLQEVWGDAAARFRLPAENTTPDAAHGDAG